MAAITDNDENFRNSHDLGPLDPSRIKDLVQRFKVCWEAHPEQALVTVMDPKEKEKEKNKKEKEGDKNPSSHRELRNIGFSLELYGTPEPGAEDVLPGSDHCRRAESALKEIAAWILCREESQCKCIYEVQGHTESLSYSPVRGNRADILVTIQILHRDNWDQPIDECEACSLKDKERALHELGACNGGWRPLSSG